MVELNHRPETCILANYRPEDNCAGRLSKIRETAGKYGARVVDGWVFPIGHRLWYVIEAHDAESVTDLCTDSGVHIWNTVSISPVLDHDRFRTKVLDEVTGKSVSDNLVDMRKATSWAR